MLRSKSQRHHSDLWRSDVTIQLVNYLLDWPLLEELIIIDNDPGSRPTTRVGSIAHYWNKKTTFMSTQPGT